MHWVPTSTLIQALTTPVLFALPIALPAMHPPATNAVYPTISTVLFASPAVEDVLNVLHLDVLHVMWVISSMGVCVHLVYHHALPAMHLYAIPAN